MRIGVISDTHIPECSKELPAQILKDFKNMDMIIHAGDLADLKVMETLKGLCPNVLAVWGNMDPYELRKKLREKEVIEAGIYKIGLTHGYGPAGELVKIMSEIFKNDNVNIIIFGHSHSAINEQIGNILYFNPGSPTDKIFAPYNSYGIIEINDKIEAKIIKI